MKNLLIVLLMLIVGETLGYTTKKGPMTIGSTQKKPDASAVLELFSSAKGFLPPRLTTVERDAIVTPATGLEIFNTDLKSPEFYNGTTWVQSGGTGTSFQITVVGHGRAIGCPLSPVYFDGADWLDAAANATATLATHVITKVIDIDTLEISQSGRFACNAHGLTVGTHYFVGVAGGLSSLPAPSFDNPVVLVEDTNTIHIMPYRASSSASVTIGQVDTVFGRTGNVIAVNGDYTASNITFAPTATLLSIETQAAIEELDAKVLAIDFSGKVENTRQIISGEGLQGGGDLTVDRTLSLDIDNLISQNITLTDNLVYWDNSNHRKTTLPDIFSLIDLSISDLNDVDETGVAVGKVLEYGGAGWIIGDKTINTDAQTASLVPFTPFSFYVSTDVQSAIQEIEGSLTTNLNAKAEETIDMIAGNHLTGGGDLTSDRTFDVTPATIDITTLLNYNANSFIDMSTVAVDVSSANDGLHVTSGVQNLDATFSLAVDIPSLTRETPANPNSDVLIFSPLTNKLGKTSVQDIVDTAAGAIVAPVTSVQGKIGVVTLNTDEITTTATNVYVTPAEKALITTSDTQLGINTPQIGTNITNIGNNASAIGINITNIGTNVTNIGTNSTDIGTINSTLGTLGLVAFSDDYNDLSNLPTLGTAAATAIGDYATAAQGITADSATQPLDNVSTLTNDAGYITGAAIPVDSVNSQTGVVVLDADDISDAATTNKFATAAELTLITTNQTNIGTNLTSIGTNTTNIGTNVTNIGTNVTDIGTANTNHSNHLLDLANPHVVTKAQVGLANVDNTSDANKPVSTAQQTALNLKANISSLATVATSGSYLDLSNTPAFGTAAFNNTGDFATAAQGITADSATQPLDNVSTLTNDAGYITSGGSPVQSVNAQTGVVVLDADDIDDTTTAHKFATAAELSQIGTNTTDIGTNATNVGTNSTNIGTNVTNIGTNTTDIGTNVTAIGLNTTHRGLVVGNPHVVTATEIGLGNVDNTSDANKPISTATQTALDLKYDATNPQGYETPAQLDARDTANRARANHTGTQLAATISDFDAAVTIYNDRFSDQSATQQTTTSSTPVDRFNVTYSLAHATTYKVTVQYDWAYDSGGADFVAELLVNASVVKTHRQEPKDSGGGNGGAGTNQRHTATFVYVFTAVAGNNDFNLRFFSDDNSAIATINQHTLTVERF